MTRAIDGARPRAIFHPAHLQCQGSETCKSAQASLGSGRVGPDNNTVWKSVWMAGPVQHWITEGGKLWLLRLEKRRTKQQQQEQKKKEKRKERKKSEGHKMGKAIESESGVRLLPLLDMEQMVWMCHGWELW